MKKLFLTMAFLLAALPAFATNNDDCRGNCSNGGDTTYNNDNRDYSTTNAPVGHGGQGGAGGTGYGGQGGQGGVGQGGSAQSGAAAGAVAGSVSNATGGDSKAYGGNSDATGGSVRDAGNSANLNANLNKTGDQKTDVATKITDKSQTSIDASDRSSYQSKTTVWAPVVHGAGAAPLATANLVVVPGVCGPRVKVISTPVIGKRFNIVASDSDVPQGENDRLEPADEPFVQKGAYLMGHEFVNLSAVVGTSSGGSFSLGGFGKNGDGAQGGGAASGGLQQIVSRIIIRDCIYAEQK